MIFIKKEEYCFNTEHTKSAFQHKCMAEQCSSVFNTIDHCLTDSIHVRVIYTLLAKLQPLIFQNVL